MSRNSLKLLALLLIRITYTTIAFFSLIIVSLFLILVSLIFATWIFAFLILLLNNNNLILPQLLFSGLVVRFSILFKRIIFKSSESIHSNNREINKDQYIIDEKSYLV